MRFGIIVNPRHRRSALAYAVLARHLQSQAVRYRTTTTTRAWPGRRQARELVDWGADLLIVFGGDGTVRAIAAELTGTKVPVLVVPTGTANVLVRHLRRHHLGEDTVRVPVNEAEYVDADGHRRREVFISMAGIGGDAEAVAGKNVVPGILGYLWGGLRALFSPGVHAQTATIPESSCWSIMASKVSHPAGPIAVFPRAEATADEFEFLAVRFEREPVTAVSRAERLRGWARVVRDGLAGTPERNPAMDYWMGSRLHITLDDTAPVHLDGDSIGDCRELSVRAGTERLLLIVPRL